MHVHLIGLPIEYIYYQDVRNHEHQTLCYSPLKWPPLMGYSLYEYNGHLPIQPSTYLQNKINELLTTLILTLNSKNYYKIK
jgi:hypothetical protein